MTLQFLDDSEIVDVTPVNRLPVSQQPFGYGYRTRHIERFIATNLANLGTAYVNILTAAADTNPTIQQCAGYSLIKLGFEVAANARILLSGRYTDHNGVAHTAWEAIGEFPSDSTWYAAGAYSLDVATATRVYDSYRIDIKFQSGSTNSLIYAILGVAG
jgi:hypothetical protein